MRNAIKLRFTPVLILWLACLLFSAGCVTVHPQPFGQFSASIQELRKGADAALQFNDEENRNWFIDKTAEEIADSSKASEAIKNLAVIGKEFEWSMNPTPLFMTSRRFRGGVYRLNTVLINYSELLNNIASEELIDGAQFDKLADDLNANLKSAAKAMKIEEPKASEKGIAIFSAAASKAARAVVEHRRKQRLTEALKANQLQIDALSAHLKEAILIAAENLWEIYEDNKKSFYDKLRDASEGSEKKRRKLVDETLKCNEDFVHRLEVLQSLHDAYAALPNAHRELTEGLEKKDISMVSIGELYEQGKHLYNLYKDLMKDDRKKK